MASFSPAPTNWTAEGIPEHPAPTKPEFRSSSSPLGISPPPHANSTEVPTSNSENVKKSHKPPAKALLSCEMCRHRKIKCDKAQPCSNCRRAGINCVSLNRQRLPRGRNGGRKKADVELKARVGRLENLVRTLEAGNGTQIDPAMRSAAMEGVTSGESQEEPVASNQADGNQSCHDTGNLSRYLGSTFWENLSHEINGLQEVLDQSDEDDEQESFDSGSPIGSPGELHHQSTFNLLLFGPNSMIVNPEAVARPPPLVVNSLCSIYLHNVDPVFKIIHGPTLSGFLQEGRPYLNYRPGHAATEALTFAVFYSAIACQTDSRCKDRYGETKDSLMAQYRFGLEVALSKADYINTTDLTVLQAFILYLLGARTHDTSRVTWTMLSVAVRIAQDAMDLHHEKPHLSPFEQEMRRRVWGQLCVMDMQASSDRGSSSLINLHDAEIMSASEVNDADFSPYTQKPITSRSDIITDASFSAMNHFGSNCGRKLNILSRGADDRAPIEIEMDWEKRRECAYGVRRYVSERYAEHLNLQKPFDLMIMKVNETVTAYMLLTVVRPMQRHPMTKPPPNISGESILNMASDMFENVWDMRQNPKLEPYAWYGHMYNKWHPIAVVAAELCVQTEGPAVERAWSTLELVYAESAKGIADSNKGMLWKPIEKLMKRARAIRAAKSSGASMDTFMAESGLRPKQSTTSSTSYQPSHQPPETAVRYTPADIDEAMKSICPPEQQQGPPVVAGFGLPPITKFDESFDDAVLGDNSMGCPDMSQQPANQWQLDMNLSSVNGNPAAGWANWESFVDGLNVEDGSFESAPSLFDARTGFAGMR